MRRRFQCFGNGVQILRLRSCRVRLARRGLKLIPYCRSNDYALCIRIDIFALRGELGGAQIIAALLGKSLRRLYDIPLTCVVTVAARKHKRKAVT